MPKGKAYNQLANLPVDAITFGMDPRKEKSRNFEEKNPAYTYRLTDKELAPRISAIALDQGLTVDHTARAFLEAALRHIHEIPFDKVPVHDRHKSLFPVDGNQPTITFVVKDDGWPVKPPPPRPPRNKIRLSPDERKRKQKERNAYVIAYRWPAELDATIKKITASTFGEPVGRADGRSGWMLTVLLRYALMLYYAGRLKFEAQPETVKMGANLVDL